MIFRLGELFCGAGGLGLVAEMSQNYYDSNNKEWGLSLAWATDYDEDSCKTYRNNLCPENPHSVICEDIRKLQLERLYEISEADALSFGFPCNDFSVVGKNKGINGSYGPLYKYCIKALNFLNPYWFIAENVGGLQTSNNGRALKIIIEELRGTGYKIYPHLFKFEQYGVPQARHRIILIGIREDFNIDFYVPTPISDINISCRNALENPPINPNAANHKLTRQSKEVEERLRYIKPGENAFTAELPEHLKLKVKGARMSHIYKRLDPEKPSYTITGSGGGGTHVYHWNENRALTNRERARLQTFPDDYVFMGTKESVRKQIGMAVPPMGVKNIFEAVLKCFAGIDYQATNINLRQFLPEPKKIFGEIY